MTRDLKMTLNIRPAPHKVLVNFGARRVHLPDSVRAYEDAIQMLAVDAVGLAGWTVEIYDRYMVICDFAVAGEPTQKRHGDIDKLVRSVLDGLTKGRAIYDDANVIDLRATKKHVDDTDAAKVGVTITVEKVD